MSSSANIKEARKRGQDRFLLETVICDLHGTCLQLGAMTAIASSSLDALARRVPPAWRHFALNDTAVMLFALRFSSQMELPEPVKEAIRNLYIDLGTFKSQLLAAVERGTKTDEAGRPVVVRLAARARDLCGKAALVLRISEPCVQARLAPLLVADSRTLVEFLNAAVSGRLNAKDGQPALPVLQQRRRAPRARVERSCRVKVAGEWRQARLLDVSRNGLKVDCAGEFAIGMPFTIALDDQRELTGTVANRNGRNVGVRLDIPLAVNDPVFEG